MKKSRMGVAVKGLLIVTLIILSGCASIGPRKVPVDRANYNSSIIESWKQQVLLNIIKIRYVEPIFFVDIGDIVAGYTMETGANVGFSRTWFDIVTNTDTSALSLGMSGKYIDRPTITYKPMTGAPFRKAVMSPMPLRNVMLGIESGVSTKFLFSLGVRSIGRLRNENLAPHNHLSSEKGFQRVVEIISALQLANAVHVISEPPQKDRDARLLLVLDNVDFSEELTALVSEFREWLDLDPTVTEYEVIGRFTPHNRQQIVLKTYSLMQIMANIAVRVDVPKEDIASQRAIPGVAGSPMDDVLGAVTVRSSGSQPVEAFVAVKFHNHWFWVEDHDLATKRVFSFLMLAFTLMQEERGSTPLQITIPVQ